MLELATTIAEPAVDVTWVFYAGEEVAAVHNGLRQLFAERPDLVAGDAALLGEPTDGVLEVGCQGTMRLAGHAARRAGPHRPAVDGPQRPAPGRSPAGRARRLRAPPPGARRLRVPRGAAGRVRRGRRGRQRRARRRHGHAQPPLRPRPHGRRGPSPRRGRCSRRTSSRATTSRWSTSRTPPRPGLRHPLLAALAGPQRPRRAGQARLDRRQPLRRRRHPGRQLRPGRLGAGPHPRRAGRAVVARGRPRALGDLLRHGA